MTTFTTLPRVILPQGDTYGRHHRSVFHARTWALSYAVTWKRDVFPGGHRISDETEDKTT